jgi:hypothetical protein
MMRFLLPAALAVASVLSGCMGPNAVDANGKPLYDNNCLIKTMCLDIPANRPGYVPNAAAFAPMMQWPVQQQPYQPPPPLMRTTNCTRMGDFVTCQSF